MSCSHEFERAGVRAAFARALEVLADVSSSKHERAKAAWVLSETDYSDVFNVLVAVAGDSREDALVSRAAGCALAKICLREQNLDKVQLSDLADAAYEGFDEYVADSQRSTREVHCEPDEE